MDRFYQFLSDAAEYGGNVTLEDAAEYFKGNRPGVLQRQGAVDVRNLVKHIPGVSAGTAAKVGRYAGKALPLLSAGANVLDVADLITSDDGLGNKVVDVGGMALGGTLGFALGGPLGASMGASAGKAITDGLQAITGGKSEEERRLEEALARLNGGIL